MTVDVAGLRQIRDALAAGAGELTVTFNYRYSPRNTLVRRLIADGAVGDVTSVAFEWCLDTVHGADYFRRWHRDKAMSGGLLVHKATHHFDLINWWLASEPETVSAVHSIQNYGQKGPFRHTHCRPCPHKGECAYYWDINTQPRLVDLYVGPERFDGYHRDGCVFREDVDAPDTMNAVVRYANGVNMSYSVNTFMPIEGYRVAFNGTRGRLEVRDYERQPWDPGEESEMYVIRNFGKREKIPIPIMGDGGHGGGDDRLRDLIFRNPAVAAHLRLPDSRAGAMSCLTGIAARRSGDEGRPVKIAELLPA